MEALSIPEINSGWIRRQKIRLAASRPLLPDGEEKIVRIVTPAKHAIRRPLTVAEGFRNVSCLGGQDLGRVLHRHLIDEIVLLAQNTQECQPDDHCCQTRPGDPW